MAADHGGRVCVTGASGQAGRAVVRELLEHDFEVTATDLAPTREDLGAGMLTRPALGALTSNGCR